MSKQLIGAAIGAVIGFALAGSDKKDPESKKDAKTDLQDKKKKDNTKKDEATE